MNSQTQKYGSASDFRTKVTLGISITLLVFVTPLSVNHFIQGRYYLGFGSLAILALFAFFAWTCRLGRYNPSITFVLFTPAITLFLAYTFHRMDLVAAFWSYPTALGFYFMLRERQAWLASIIFNASIIPQAWLTLDPSNALRFTVTLITVSVFSAIFVRVISSQQSKLESQVATDPLTGLLNRTLLHDTLEHAVQQNRRMDAPMTLVTLDLDNFKKINDTLGHDAGDTVLRNIGELLRGRIRRSDNGFRLGGEEFLVLLYDTDLEHSLQFAEELRNTIESLPILPNHQVTTSIGVATLQTGEDWDDWMKRCDQKLYSAKLNGRNLVVH